MAIKRNVVEEAKEAIEEPIVEVKETKKEEKTPAKKKKTIYVVNNLLNFRDGASKTANVLKVLSVGDEVEVLNIDGDWAEVVVGKTKGYVMAQYITVK